MVIGKAMELFEGNELGTYTYSTFAKRTYGIVYGCEPMTTEFP